MFFLLSWHHYSEANSIFKICSGLTFFLCNLLRSQIYFSDSNKRIHYCTCKLNFLRAKYIEPSTSKTASVGVLTIFSLVEDWNYNSNNQLQYFGKLALSIPRNIADASIQPQAG